MNAFQVNDMTCGHCAGKIRNALGALDPQATVNIDVASRRVEVQSALATAVQLQGAIEQAGYTPVALEPGSPPADSPRQGRGCCG